LQNAEKLIFDLLPEQLTFDLCHQRHHDHRHYQIFTDRARVSLLLLLLLRREIGAGFSRGNTTVHNVKYIQKWRAAVFNREEGSTALAASWSRWTCGGTGRGITLEAFHYPVP